MESNEASRRQEFDPWLAIRFPLSKGVCLFGGAPGRALRGQRERRWRRPGATSIGGCRQLLSRAADCSPTLLFGDGVHRAEDLEQVALGLSAVAVPALLLEQTEARHQGSVEALVLPKARRPVPLAQLVVERQRIADGPDKSCPRRLRASSSPAAVVEDAPLAGGQRDRPAGGARALQPLDDFAVRILVRPAHRLALTALSGKLPMPVDLPRVRTLALLRQRKHHLQPGPLCVPSAPDG